MNNWVLLVKYSLTVTFPDFIYIFIYIHTIHMYDIYTNIYKNSVAFSTFPMLCKHFLYLLYKTFSSLQKHPLNSYFFIIPASPPCWKPQINFLSLEISRKHYHTLCGLLCLPSFPLA